jgi:HEAT repeat protein
MFRAIFSCCLVCLCVGWANAGGPQKAPQSGNVAGLIKKLESANANDKLAALTALAELGPAAADAVPVLIQVLQTKNEDVRLNAAIALGKIGKASVPAVVKLLDAGEADIRYYAVWTLGWVGPDAKETAPRVIRALADKDESVRRKAAYALGRIAPDAKTAVGPLLQAFADTNADVRQAAAEAVAKFGAEAVPALVEALKDDSISVRREAARAVAKIGPDAKDAIPGLRILLFSEKADLVNDAAEALANIGKASLPTLTEALKNDSSMIRSTSVRALGKIGAEAVPTLVDALGDKQVDVRRQAAQVLVPLRINDKMVVLALAHAATDSDASVRQQCLRGLQFLGAGAKPAAAMLVRILQESSDMQTRLQILSVLQNIPDEPKLILPVAVGLLKDANPSIRQTAIFVLSGQGAAAVPHLITVLKEGDPAAQMQAVNALQRVPGADLKEALPALLPLLKQGQPFNRRNVVVTLGRIGEPAIPHLIDCLKDSEPQVRWPAVDALRTLGPAAKKAVPILEELPLKDPNIQVRRSAVAAVAMIEPEKLPDLFAAVKKNPDENIRFNAYQALVSYRIPAKTTFPPLMDALQDTSVRTRQIACQAIGNMSPDDAKEAVPLLTKLVNDPNPSVSNAARVALQRVKGP